MLDAVIKPFLTEKEVSHLTGFSVSKLQKDRFICSGIPYLKIGRTVRYVYEDVVAYMEQFKVNFIKN